MVWKHCYISEESAARIKRVMILGYKSVSDFVQGPILSLSPYRRVPFSFLSGPGPMKKAVMDKLPQEESRVDMIEMRIKEEKDLANKPEKPEHPDWNE